MTFTPSDKKQIDNLIKILSRAKMELEGVEVIVAADAMRWLSKLQKDLESEMANKPSPSAPEAVSPPVPVKKKRAMKNVN